MTNPADILRVFADPKKVKLLGQLCDDPLPLHTLLLTLELLREVTQDGPLLSEAYFPPMVTLKSKWHFALFGVFLYVTAPLVEAAYYVIEERRGAYPPDADAIAIPIMQYAQFLLLFSPLYALAAWAAIRSYQGGRSLLAFDTTRPVRGVLWSLLLGGLALYDISDAIHSAYRILPSEAVSSLLWAYLLLCLRSSLAGSTMPKPEQQVVL